MSFDPWQQWQSFTNLWGAAGRSAAPLTRAVDPAELAATAQRFARAAEEFFAAHKSSPAEAAAATHAFADFLRDEFATIAAPWSKSGQGMESAALGVNRAQQERAQRAAAAWRRAEDAQRRLTRLWSDILREAAAEFTARIGSAAAAPVTPATLNQLYDTWVDCAEQAYSRAAHTDPFSGALADCVNAASDFRRETQSEVEAWAKLLNLPTRSELNSLADRLRSVEKSLRELQASSGTNRKHDAKPRGKSKSAGKRNARGRAERP